METAIQPADPPAPEHFEWTIFLLARHPGRGGLALAVCAFTTWFAWSLTHSAWLAGMAAFVLVASLATFFFPTRFTLDGEGVRVVNLIYRRKRAWREFRGLRRQGDRLKLLTLPYDSRLDNYRGMLLILPEDHETIVEFIRRKLERPAVDAA